MEQDYDQLITRFIAFETSLKRSNLTLTAYQNTLKEFFITYLQNKPLKEITIEDIQLFTTWKQNIAIKRQKEGISGQGAGAFLKTKEIQSSTMNRHFAAIKQFLTFYNYSNLSKQIRTLKIQKKFDIIEYEDIKKIFEVDTIREYYESKTKKKDFTRINFYIDRLKLLLDFDLAHGLRLQEVVDLDKSDLKIDRKIPVIEILNGKGGKQREVYLSPTWIVQYQNFLRKYPLAARGNKIFTTYNGGALSYSTLRTYIKTLGYFIDAPRLSFHKLRHCYALKQYELSKDIVSLSKNLGHDSIQTTMIYLSKIGLSDKKQFDILKND